jgi:hypothetical protein
LIQEPNLDKALRQCLGSFALFLHDLRGTVTVRGARAVISVQSSIEDPLTRFMPRKPTWCWWSA